MIRGHIENGRKYNSLRDDYWGPSDDQQFETMDAGHLLYLLLNSDHPTLLFRSPVASPEYILDIVSTFSLPKDVASEKPLTFDSRAQGQARGLSTPPTSSQKVLASPYKSQ